MPAGLCSVIDLLMFHGDYFLTESWEIFTAQVSTETAKAPYFKNVNFNIVLGPILTTCYFSRSLSILFVHAYTQQVIMEPLYCIGNWGHIRKDSHSCFVSAGTE